MSFWTDAVRGFQKLALLDDKVDRALAMAEEARRHSPKIANGSFGWKRT